jgi:hypothetical protein
MYPSTMFWFRQSLGKFWSEPIDIKKRGYFLMKQPLLYFVEEAIKLAQLLCY